MSRIQPGEVRNPKGNNQWTYRQRAEESLERWCREHGDEVIERVVKDAIRGKGYAMTLLLARVLPVKQEVELSVEKADVTGLLVALEDYARKLDQRKKSEVELDQLAQLVLPLNGSTNENLN